MEGPSARSMLVSRHLGWSPHKHRRSAVSIHFNVWMPVEVSSCEESPAPSPRHGETPKSCHTNGSVQGQCAPQIAPMVPVSTNCGCAGASTHDPEDDAQD